MRRNTAIGFFLGLAICLASPGFAYIGPGAGLSAIGTVVALVGAILLAIIGFVWYPVKRLHRRFTSSRDNGKNKKTEDDNSADSEEP